MINANVEKTKDSVNVDGFKASRTELLLFDKGNYREVVNRKTEELKRYQMLCFCGENSNQNCWPRTKKTIVTGGDCEKEARRKRQGSPCSASSCSEKKKGKRKIKASPVSKTVRMGRGKLGAHVKALQQLVSPMGKWDTASVLHEAFQCIRFLHDQIKMLSSAYEEAQTESAMADGDLRRRGLCLVPVSSAASAPAGLEN